MKKVNTGTFQKVPSGYNAFVPASLPFEGIELDSEIISLLSKAERGIGELKSIELILPNANLLIQKYALKEALLSSQIEGTRTTIAEVIESKKDNMMDVREVKNCMEAMEYGINKITKENFPLCMRLLKEIQGILMHNVRGGEQNKTPGEFRRSQNWIGGVSPSTAIFCPPIPEVMIEAISNLEKYLHEDNDLPDLIKCSLIHYQFEAIHPFCDGNGRTGRMLIILYLISKGILNSPILYLSLYFKQNRNDYYHHLLVTSKNGDVYSWIKFFLYGIIAVSTQVIETTKAIVDLKNKDIEKIGYTRHKIMHSSRLEGYRFEIIDYLMQNPLIEVKDIQKHLDVAYNTANTIVQKLVSLEVLEQISEGERNKKYVYRKYMNILEQGCENF
jgi:Fic family protein